MSAKKSVPSHGLSSTGASKRIHSPDFRILEIFQAVANSASFHQAARKLETTQPLVSMRIRQLEELLGVRLLDRDRRDRRLVALTPKGKEFRVHAERLIRMRDEMVGTFRDPSTVRGIVRLGVSESIVHTWLPALLKQVDAAYPNLELEIEVDISTKLRDLLVARDLNLAFLLDPIDAPDLRSRPLCKLPVEFMASEELALPRRPMTLEDIVGMNHRIITFARNTQPLMVLRELLADRGLHPTIWASASLETVVRLAIDGLGIAVIPPAILKKKVEARDRLRRLSIDIELPPLDYVVSWPVASESTDGTTVQKVIDIAMKVAREWTKSA
jgi:DNA-binding transcriptional LysR family regulator